MTDAKHTPGPWRVQERFGTVFTTSNPEEGTGMTNAIASACRRGRDAGSEVTLDESEANARLIAAAPCMLEALRMVLNYAERETCKHEETWRGGAIWEICSCCGAKWADDEGGKPEWQDPPEWAAARAAIAKAEGRGGDRG